MTLDEVKKRYVGADTFKFGDGPALSARLIGLVREGKKRATCGALRDYETGVEAMPQVGRIDIALNWDGTPALAIRTVSLDPQRFCDVTADFALAEGENETLEGWQQDHEEYFSRNGGFDPEMMLLCERFELVEDFA